MDLRAEAATSQSRQSRGSACSCADRRYPHWPGRDDRPAVVVVFARQRRRIALLRLGHIAGRIFLQNLKVMQLFLDRDFRACYTCKC